MGGAVRARTMHGMKASYAVVWSVGAGPIVSGRLELHPHAVVLDGASASLPVVHSIPFLSLQAIRVGRVNGDRLAGQPTLVLERRDGPVVRIASVAQPGIVSELARQLIRLQVDDSQPRRTLVVVPLKPGTETQAQELVDHGPPFDAQRVGLTRHQVFLSQEAVYFLFETEASARPLEELLSEPGVWRAASAWRDIVAGPPRIADDAYDWHAPPREVHAGLGL
jgi:hypothetical protein